MSDTTQSKLAAARSLIQQKQYAAARNILLTIQDDPTAKQWLVRLASMPDQAAKPPASASIARPGRRSTILLAGLGGLLVIVVIGAAFVVGQNSAPVPAAYQTAAAVSTWTENFFEVWSGREIDLVELIASGGISLATRSLEDLSQIRQTTTAVVATNDYITQTAIPMTETQNAINFSTGTAQAQP